MKTIQVQSTTNKGTWLADINLIGVDSYLTGSKMELVFKVYSILCERYGDILYWTISKYYN